MKVELTEREIKVIRTLTDSVDEDLANLKDYNMKHLLLDKNWAALISVQKKLKDADK